jgi:hypothetical protein
MTGHLTADDWQDLRLQHPAAYNFLLARSNRRERYELATKDKAHPESMTRWQIHRLAELDAILGCDA